MKFDKPEAKDKQSDGKSDYLVLKDGDAVNIVLRGEIHKFYSVFGQKGEVTPGTPNSRLRYKVNALVNENGLMKAKIYEFGPSVYDQLYEISTICDVPTTKLRISRKGSTKDETRYTLLPVIKEPLSPAIIQQLEGIELHILDKTKMENLEDIWT